MTSAWYWLASAFEAAHNNMRFMAWNSFLALIPLFLSVWLFRRRRLKSIAWVIGLITFIAFLPNAPYVLTDIIHLVHDIRYGYSIWIIALVLVPQYLLFMFIGFQAYVISLINLGYFLRLRGLGRYLLPTELFIHMLSAVGIYLGRFHRFNSWDILTQPEPLISSLWHTLLAQRPAAIMLITFGVISVLYWLLKQVTLALAMYLKVSRQAKSEILMLGGD
ncbi:DUF1361 domain-containing protein [Almyronema epifaneia]|uniref:DUF1361 domain-containing protein n=1 Tax=Almyronema epifaneia S1 TaxID=2991925 RepID=A0ABW6IJ67_9CYAN